VGERSLHTREVAGSKPAAPIRKVPAIRPVLGRWCDFGAVLDRLLARRTFAIYWKRR
jgi:hypothetical protein